jgi:hypothetical protein
MHKRLAQSSLWREIDVVNPTTKGSSSSCCKFDDPQSLRDAHVHNRGVREMENVLGATGYI